MRAVDRAWHAVTGAIDLRDVVVVVGLGALAAGLYQFSPALAPIAVGAFLVYLGLFHRGPTRPRRR